MCEKSASLETLDDNIHCNILRFVARFDDRCFSTLKALTSTCKVYYSLLKNPYILRCICEEVCPSATGADSLELIAFMAHANCFLRPQSNSVFFEYATTEMKKRSRTPLSIANTLLKKFPKATLHIDAHVGLACPRTIAGNFSLNRGIVTAMWFHNRIEQEDKYFQNQSNSKDEDYCLRRLQQIKILSWGRNVAKAGQWIDDESSSRCELHFSYDGGPIYPPRAPEYSCACLSLTQVDEDWWNSRIYPTDRFDFGDVGLETIDETLYFSRGLDERLEQNDDDFNGIDDNMSTDGSEEPFRDIFNRTVMRQHHGRLPLFMDEL